ncbi:NUMOD4 domain-containing protein, partial [Chryseobacterium oranimense]|uniref:NUMOD4 domain-containing protein n=1 Tax=Chryseobacterium oranimense TaxID=421058 RepID=UPI001E398860
LIRNILNLEKQGLKNYSHCNLNCLGSGVFNLRSMESKTKEDLPGEIWQEIPYYYGYEVSNYGRVKSYMKKRPIILKKTLASGKHIVKITKKKGIYDNVIVSRLVASVFIRNPYLNEVVKFKDGNCLNDAAKNLEWISRQQSIINASGREGYSQKGIRNGMALLNEEKASEIRKMKSAGLPYGKIASKYGVSISCVMYVVQKKYWKV